MNPLFTISHTKPDVNDFEHVSAFLENNSLPECVSVMHREEGAWMIDFEVTNQADKGAAVHWSMFQGVRFTIESTDMGAPALGEYVVEIELALQVEESPALQVQESPQHLHTTHSLQNFEVHPYFQNNAWFAFQIGVVQKKWTSEWCWTSRESDEVSASCTPLTGLLHASHTPLALRYRGDVSDPPSSSSTQVF